MVLLEAAAVGQAGSGAGVGLLRQRGRHRLPSARNALRQAVRQTGLADDVACHAHGASILRRLRIRCQLEAQDAIYFTRESERVPALRRELRARRSAGLKATWLAPAQLQQIAAVDASDGIRTRGNGQLDPYRACLGLAAAAVGRGTAVCEGLAVTRVCVERAGLAVTTDAGGTVRAARVIVATRGTSPLVAPLGRHLRSTHTYAVATPPLALGCVPRSVSEPR